MTKKTISILLVLFTLLCPATFAINTPGKNIDYNDIVNAIDQKWAEEIVANICAATDDISGFQNDVSQASISFPIRIPTITNGDQLFLKNDVWHCLVFDDSQIYATISFFQHNGALTYSITNGYAEEITEQLQKTTGSSIRLCYVENEEGLHCIDEAGKLFCLKDHEEKGNSQPIGQFSLDSVLFRSITPVRLDMDCLYDCGKLGSSKAVTYQSLSGYPHVYADGTTLMCWDASILSMMQYMFPLQYGGYTSLYNSGNGGTWQNIMNAFNYYFNSLGFVPTHHNSIISRTTVINYINTGVPVYIHSNNSSWSSVHSTVVCGYMNNTSTMSYALYMMNPGYSSSANYFEYTITRSWANEGAAFYYNNEVFTWFDTVTVLSSW
jgi:hypothetical protein